MTVDCEPLFRHLPEIAPVATSHSAGLKQVLLSASETHSAVTQIAVTTMRRGESVAAHVHPTMDEHYLIESGRGIISIEDREYPCGEGDYLLVPAGRVHDLRVMEDMKFVTIGIAYDK